MSIVRISIGKGVCARARAHTFVCVCVGVLCTVAVCRTSEVVVVCKCAACKCCVQMRARLCLEGMERVRARQHKNSEEQQATTVGVARISVEMSSLRG